MNGPGVSGSDRVLFDPILNQLVNVEMGFYDEGLEDSGLVCSHCYQRIFGKVYRIGNDNFDAYCYSMRYSLGYVQPIKIPDSTLYDAQED